MQMREFIRLHRFEQLLFDTSCGNAMRTTLKQHQVKTKRPKRKGVTPRLPHERDESDDSQESAIRDDIKQAYVDLQSGQVDTDLRNTTGVDAVVNDRPGQSPDKVVKKSF